MSPIDLSTTRFGYFGEFAFGLTSWLPYLNYLKHQGLKPIKTAGPLGSRPFYYFSDDHMELDFTPQTTWGDANQLLKIKCCVTERLIAPSNQHRRKLRVGGYEWLNTECHKNLSTKHYKNLEFGNHGLPQVSDLVAKPYCIISVKTYYNYGTTFIQTFYNTNDLKLLIRRCKCQGLRVLLNRFPTTEDEGNIYIPDASILTHEVCSQSDVVDLRTIYSQANSLAACNRIQIYLLQRSQHVFATNGGAAFLSMITAPRVSLMLQGGGDYAELKLLSDIYKRKFDIAYTVPDLLKLIETRGA